MERRCAIGFVTDPLFAWRPFFFTAELMSMMAFEATAEGGDRFAAIIDIVAAVKHAPPCKQRMAYDHSFLFACAMFHPSNNQESQDFTGSPSRESRRLAVWLGRQTAIAGT
jgi:hypothetical protein